MVPVVNSLILRYAGKRKCKRQLEEEKRLFASVPGNNTLPASTNNNPEAEPSHLTTIDDSTPTAFINQDVPESEGLTLFDFNELCEDNATCIEYL